MKTAALIFAFLAVTASAAQVPVKGDSLVARLEDAARGALEDKVIAFAECLRKILREGGELTGGKILDPLDSEHVDVNITIPDQFDIQGALDNVHVEGISSFNFTNLKINILQTKVDYGLVFEGIKAKGLYDLIINLVGADPLFGKGPFDIQLNTISIDGFIKIKLLNLKYIELVELQVLLGVGDMKFQIDGVMNDPELTEQINAFLNESLPELLKENQQFISDTINTVAKDVLNPILNQMTLQDLLDLIGGGGLEC